MLCEAKALMAAKCPSCSSHPRAITNISMGTEIDSVNEFEKICASIRRFPSARAGHGGRLGARQQLEPVRRR